MDGPDADRVRLVPAGGEQPGEAAALLRPAVPAGGGGRDLLRAARRADRPGLGRTYAARLHLQHQGVQPVHPASDAGQGVPGRPARGSGCGREGPGVPEGRRPGGGGGGLGPVPGRARAAARRGQAGRDPAAVPALVPDRARAQGLHPGLRAAGRAGPGVRGVPQPHLDDRGQPARRRWTSWPRTGSRTCAWTCRRATRARSRRCWPPPATWPWSGCTGTRTSGRARRSRRSSATGTAMRNWTSGRAVFAACPGRPRSLTCCSTTATATGRTSTPSSSRALARCSRPGA